MHSGRVWGTGWHGQDKGQHQGSVCLLLPAEQGPQQEKTKQAHFCAFPLLAEAGKGNTQKPQEDAGTCKIHLRISACPPLATEHGLLSGNCPRGQHRLVPPSKGVREAKHRTQRAPAMKSHGTAPQNTVRVPGPPKPSLSTPNHHLSNRHLLGEKMPAPLQLIILY